MQFRVLGVPVRVELSFFLVALMLNMRAMNRPQAMIVWVAVVFTGVLLHELGHALAIRFAGRSPQIVLQGFGGATSWQNLEEGPLSPGRQLLVALAGPLTGFAFAAMVLIGSVVASGSLSALPRHFNGDNASIGWTAAYYALYVNGVWSVLNLLPILPLDGGVALSAFVELFARGKGRVVALVSTLVIGTAVSVLAFWAQWYIALIMLLLLVFGAARELRDEVRLGPDRALLPLLFEARRLANAGDHVNARIVGERLLQEAKTAAVRNEAYQVLAFDALLLGDDARARHYLDSRPQDMAADPVIEGVLLLRENQFDRGIARIALRFTESLAPKFVLQTLEDASLRAYDMGRFIDCGEGFALLYQITRDHRRTDHAIHAAGAFARGGDPERALELLEAARQEGYENRYVLENAEELESVRRLPQWPVFLAKLG